MKKEIVKKDTGLIAAEEEARINELTGYQSPIVFPGLKFKADEGIFYRTTGRIGDDGKPEYEAIGKTIEAHIITANQTLAISSRKATRQCWSREFTGSSLVLYDENNNVVEIGKYADLKEKYDLVYTKVLYLYFEDQPYRMKIAGSKLTGLFAYLRLGNPVFNMTKLSRGAKKTNGGVDYYELVFTRSEPVNRKVYLPRIEAVNDHLKKYSDRLVAVPEEEHPAIDVEEIPFGEPALPV